MYTRLDAKRCGIARAIDPHPKEIVMSGPAIMTSSYLVFESGIPPTGYSVCVVSELRDRVEA